MSKQRITKYSAVMLAAVLSLSLAISGCKKNNGAADGGTKRGSITVSIYDRGQVPKEEGTYADNRWTRWMNDNGPTDVKFVPIPRNESQQKYSLLFASGEAPDIILEYDNAFVNSLWSQKQLLPLDDLIEKHSTVYKKLLEKYPTMKKLGTKPDGKLYEFGKIMNTEILGMMVIRKDWLDKFGLMVPETIEELYHAADLFANHDPDGNGRKDTYGINLSQIASYFVDSMFQNEMFIVENGELIRQFNRIKPAYEFKKRLFENNIVDKDFLTDTNGRKAEQDFASGKLGIFLSYGKFISDNFNLLKKTEPHAEIVAMPFPRTEFGHFGPEFNPPFHMTGSINANTKDPAAAMQFIDFMMSQPVVETFSKGIEGVHYKDDANGCPQPLDAEKNKVEMGYISDYMMFMTTYNVDTCSIHGRSLASTDPIDQEWIRIAQEARKMYLDPKRPHPGFTHAKYRPALEKELNTIFEDGWLNMNDIMARTIVSGSSYTVDDGVKDVMDTWNKAGGKKLEDWYENWYKENKDTWIFMDDLYKLKLE